MKIDKIYIIYTYFNIIITFLDGTGVVLGSFGLPLLRLFRLPCFVVPLRFLPTIDGFSIVFFPESRVLGAEQHKQLSSLILL